MNVNDRPLTESKWYYSNGIYDVPELLSTDNANGYTGPFETKDDAWLSNIQEYEALLKKANQQLEAETERANKAESALDDLRNNVAEFIFCPTELQAQLSKVKTENES